MEENKLIPSPTHSVVAVERDSLVSRGLQLADKLAQHTTKIVQRGESISLDKSSQIFAELQYEIGLMYKDGVGDIWDHDEAIRRFRRAAERGHAGAQYELFGMVSGYEGYGEAVPADEGFRWLRSAAEQGYACAQFHLGCLYIHDGCFGLDDAEAIAWFQKAALQGDANAQYQLGLLTYNQSRDAESWLQESAEQGHFGAQFQLDLIHGAAMLVLTNLGRVYWGSSRERLEATRNSRGEAIARSLSLDPGEIVVSLLPVRDFDSKKCIFMATKLGTVKKTPLDRFSNPRTKGIIALDLEKEDQLIFAQLTSGEDNILIATHDGMAIHFPEKDVRPMGRTAIGVIGIRLEKGDQVVGVSITRNDRTVLSISENGFGRRSRVGEYRIQHRGGSGLVNMISSGTVGKVVAMLTVDDDDEIVVATTDGATTHIAVRTIQTIGRDAPYVKMMTLNPGTRISSISVPYSRELINAAVAKLSGR